MGEIKEDRNACREIMHWKITAYMEILPKFVDSMQSQPKSGEILQKLIS